MRFLLRPALVLAGLLVAAPAVAQTAAPPRPAGLQYAVPEGASGAPTADALRTMAPDEREASFRARRAMSGAVRRAVVSADSWEAADAAVRAEMGRHPDVPAWMTDQAAGVLMLGHHLLAAPPSAARDEALGFYLDRLVRHGSPEAVYIDRALGLLAGRWPEARIAETARRALPGIERDLQRRLRCEACPLAEMVAPAAAREHVAASRLLSEEAEAARSLRSRAGR